MTSNAIDAAVAAASPPEAEGEVAATGASAAASSLNGREARNLAEKHRRDKLNASIQELATMVPHVAESTRRLDKTAVLRFAAHGLRIQHVFGKSAARKRLRRSVLPSASASSPPPPDTSEQMWQLRLTDMLMHIVDSFLITLTCHGQIVLISASVEQLLGHCQSDLYGQSILQITHPDDHAQLRQQLIPRDMESLFRGGGGQDEAEDDAGSVQAQRRRHLHSTADDEELSEQEDDELDDLEMEIAADSDAASDVVGGGGAAGQHCHRTRSDATASPQRRRRSRAHLAAIDQRLRSDRRCFSVRLARAGGSTRSTESSSSGPAAAAARSYECVKIDGYFRRSDCSTTAGNFPIVSQLIRRSRASSSSSSAGGVGGTGELPLQHDAIAQAALHGISGNDIVLVAVGRIIRTPRVLNNVCEAHQLEYKTRHLIDGRIVDCDPRISLVAGYMQSEVCQLSPFSFMHQDDVKFVIVALREMYDLNQNYGESCFRLLTRNGHFIYLQSKGTFEIHPESNEVVTFTCLNTLLDEETGRRKLYEMKTKFEMMINTKVASNSLEDAPASINPQQLERIVFSLIENLHQRHERYYAMQDSGDELSWDQTQRYARTPPLSLVPPAADSVKISLSKSIRVVNVTAARNLQHNQQQRASSMSGCGSSEASLSPASSLDQNETSTTTAAAPETTASPTAVPTEIIIDAAHVQRRPSVLQMSGVREQLQPRTPSPSNFHAPPAIVSPPHHRSSSQYVKKQKFSSVLKTLFSTSSATTVVIDEENDAEEDTETNNSPSKRIRQQDVEATCYSPISSFASPSSCTSSLSANSSSDAADIHSAISATIEHVDQTLHTIGQNVRNLVQQRARLPPASSASSAGAVSRRIIDQRLDAIKIEHRQEQQMLSNIKSELGVGAMPTGLVVQKQQQQQKQQLQQNSNKQHSRSSTVIRAALSSSPSLFAAPNISSTLLAKLPDSTTLIRRGKPL